MPIDDLHETNAPSHPELLDLLAREFAAGKFDHKRLVQAIVSTRAYQRSSAAADQSDSSPELYAHAIVRPFTAEALLASLCSALEVDEKTLFAPQREADKRDASEINPWDATPRIRFIEHFRSSERDPAAFEYGAPQMLTRLNEPLFQSGGGAAARFAKENLSLAAAIEQIYLTTLSRRPTREELTAAEKLLSAQAAPTEGYARLMWLMFCQSEFVMNH
jgi:hypothetical protein